MKKTSNKKAILKHIIQRFLLSVSIILTMMTYSQRANAQVSINSDGVEYDVSAMLDVQSTERGFLPPRMTNIERDGINIPANGLIIYNTTTKCMNFFLDNEWKEFCGVDALPIVEYTIGEGGACMNTVVNGIYSEGIELDISNTITIDVTVTSIGDWSINTDTINGYSFSGSGTFVSTGVISVTLGGKGLPAVSQVDSFTAIAGENGGECSFDIVVNAAPVFNCGDFLEFGNQNYQTVEVGTQCWMAENLNIGTMLNNNTAQTDNAILEKYCYDDLPANCVTYGGLYQWGEMMQYSHTEHAVGICPSGWHLPSDAEWKIMELQLGMSLVEAHKKGERGTDEGGKLRESGLTHWETPNQGATNSSGFTALPGGYQVANQAEHMGYYSFFWTSSEYGSFAWERSMRNVTAKVSRHDNYKSLGISVRCVKGGAGSVSADYEIGMGGACDNTNVNGEYFEGVDLYSSNTVTLEATVNALGNWNITTETENGYSFSGSGTFISLGVTEITLYGEGTPGNAQIDNFTATADANGGNCTFSVNVADAPICISPVIYHGKAYNTVLIGAQCWMGENLNVGGIISGDEDQTDNGIIEKYCYNNLPANCDIYGGLYQWDEMMSYSEVDGARGICPVGWHVASDEDWKKMERFLGLNETQLNMIGERGLYEGGELKEAGTNHWLAPNEGATNTSGFTALPGGERSSINSSFESNETWGLFWTSTKDFYTSNYMRAFGNEFSQIIRYTRDSAGGYSVRCLKD